MAKDKVVNIFQLLVKAKENEAGVSRKELLKDLNVEDFFAGGAISIDKRTCQGVECKLCIEVCPTNALFMGSAPRLLGGQRRGHPQRNRGLSPARRVKTCIH